MCGVVVPWWCDHTRGAVAQSDVKILRRSSAPVVSDSILILSRKGEFRSDKRGRPVRVCVRVCAPIIRVCACVAISVCARVWRFVFVRMNVFFTTY